jgi:hypothetical protein
MNFRTYCIRVSPSLHGQANCQVDPHRPAITGSGATPSGWLWHDGVKSSRYRGIECRIGKAPPFFPRHFQGSADHIGVGHGRGPPITGVAHRADDHRVRIELARVGRRSRAISSKVQGKVVDRSPLRWVHGINPDGCALVCSSRDYPAIVLTNPSLCRMSRKEIPELPFARFDITNRSRPKQTPTNELLPDTSCPSWFMVPLITGQTDLCPEIPEIPRVDGVVTFGKNSATPRTWPVRF